MSSTKSGALSVVSRRGGEVKSAQGFTVLQGSVLEAVVGRERGGAVATITASLEIVTPEMAEALLGRKRPNRTVSHGRVDAYARQMKAGKWRPSSQGIALDEDGHLIDGEHRLTAITVAAVPVIMLVVRGLPVETQNVLDAGRLRVAGDQYNITFQATDGRMRMAVAKLVHLIRNGWADASSSLSTEELFTIAADQKPMLDWAVTTFGARNRVAPAPVMAAWIWAYGAMPALAEHASNYVDGSGLPKMDPLLALRELVTSPSTITRGGSSSSRLEILMKATRALSLKAQGKQARRLYASKEGLLYFADKRGEKIAKAWDWYASREG